VLACLFAVEQFRRDEVLDLVEESVLVKILDKATDLQQ